MSGNGDEQSPLRVVATAASEPEAELIRQRLAQVGVSAIVQRTIGGPEWGPSGSRYVYVRASELERARVILAEEEP
jgi:hypothetical protein